MRAADEVEVVLVQELGHHLGAERERNTSVVLAPTADFLVGVRPQEVAKQTLVGDVGGPHDPPDLLHGLQVGGETSVAAEDLLVDDGGQREAVEAVGEGLPQLDVVPPLALVVEAVDAVDASALVVASQQEEVLRVLDLVRQQQRDRLQRLLASVDVIPQEEVVGLRRETPVLEKPQQVVVLPVHVSADLQRSLQLQQDGLAEEDLPALEAQPPDVVLRQLDALARPGPPHLEEAGDDFVNVQSVRVSHVLFTINYTFYLE